LNYLDPLHSANSMRTLLLAQLGSAGLGFIAFHAFGAGYGAAASSLVTSIVLMVVCDAVHPPDGAMAAAWD
jgi:HPP family